MVRESWGHLRNSCWGNKGDHTWGVTLAQRKTCCSCVNFWLGFWVLAKNKLWETIRTNVAMGQIGEERLVPTEKLFLS